jgi:hypothetical protein
MKWIAFVLISVFVLTGVALAQPSGEYTLSWWTVAGGGDTLSVSGDYALSGTSGQPVAGGLTGGDYTLDSGFWSGTGIAPAYRVYLPLVLRQLSR